MTSHNPNALAVAQSASEIFDVMHPPTVGFDMYTDRAVPTGESKPRGLVHELKMWHRSVRVCLVDPDRGMVALQKRSQNKDTFPKMWEIGAAGHIESWDESRPTAVRELAEELGVICVEKDLRFLGCVPVKQACLGGCNCFEDLFCVATRRLRPSRWEKRRLRRQDGFA